jgi:hypothetical protein
MPALVQYAGSSTAGILDTVERARAARVPGILDEFLAKRFGPRIGQRVADAHMDEEHRPIETIWDVVTGATAYARSIPDQSDRLAFERDASALLNKV